jgi:hypothetical protein
MEARYAAAGARTAYGGTGAHSPGTRTGLATVALYQDFSRCAAALARKPSGCRNGDRGNDAARRICRFACVKRGHSSFVTVQWAKNWRSCGGGVAVS